MICLFKHTRISIRMMMCMSRASMVLFCSVSYFLIEMTVPTFPLTSVWNPLSHQLDTCETIDSRFSDPSHMRGKVSSIPFLPNKKSPSALVSWLETLDISHFFRSILLRTKSHYLPFLLFKTINPVPPIDCGTNRTICCPIKIMRNTAFLPIYITQKRGAMSFFSYGIAH